jgi:hypothetical protein
MAKSKKKIPGGISWRGRYSFSASLAAGTAAVNRKSGRMTAIGPKLSGLKSSDRINGSRPMRLSTIGLPLVTAWILWALARGKGC